MTRRQQPTEPKRAVLQMPRSEAETQIRERISKGQQLIELQIRNDEELERARSERDRWSDFNAELLRRIVDTDDLANDYNAASGGVLLGGGRSPLSAEVKEFRSDINRYVTCLESICDRLKLIPEALGFAQPTNVQLPGNRLEAHRRVFVVHGHDEEAKQSVARCLEKLGLEAIILHEQPNRGRTIIEKFEDYADVGFAAVLLTPDDAGAVKTAKDNLRPRARQNVIFELGFFIGKLGRQRVCALYRDDVELPSDFSGILWVHMDPAGAWRFDLGRELRAAGLDADLNKLA